MKTVLAPATLLKTCYLNLHMRREISLPQLSAPGITQLELTALDWAGAGTQLHVPGSSVFQTPRTGLGKWQVMCQLAEKFDEKELEIHRE